MERLIYLDNSATTKPSSAAVEAAVNAMKNSYGNPSSLYEFGMVAEDIVTDARISIANRLSCREDEVYFTIRLFSVPQNCYAEMENILCLQPLNILRFWSLWQDWKKRDTK